MKRKSKGDVQWFVPKRKTPIAYSTVSTKLLIDTFSDEDKTRTIQNVHDLINYDNEAKKILKLYIDRGYGQEFAHKWFG